MIHLKDMNNFDGDEKFSTLVLMEHFKRYYLKKREYHSRTTTHNHY